MSYPGLQDKLATAAEKSAGQPVRFIEVSRVVETSRGQVVWDGIVTEYSTLNGEVVFAWIVFGGQEPRYVTVLKTPPVTDALTAVRAWLVSEARKP